MNGSIPKQAEELVLDASESSRNSTIEKGAILQYGPFFDRLNSETLASSNSQFFNLFEYISLYIHIPFCRRKCPYCHFYSVYDDESIKDRYLQALVREIEQKKSLFSKRHIVSLYFGGGTPFLFGVERIKTILDYFDVVDCEITLEANPESISEEKLEEYRAIGVNRLSFGVQSFDQRELQLLGRCHSVEQAIQAVHLAKPFGNISIDLMYELPGQTLSSWKRTLEQACSLPIQHISLYNLMIEPESAWYRKKEAIVLPGEQMALAMYEAAVDITSKHGFEQYEISAFSRPGFHSNHNSGYWIGREFLGFGAAAFSFYNNYRFSNVADIRKYCSEEESVDFSETLTSEERVRELIAVGLRMNQGVDVAALEEHWGAAAPSLSHLEEAGLLVTKKGRVGLTQRGRLLYDAVAAEII